MLSSIKKWVKSEENSQEKQISSGFQTMRSDLQKKFSKGVQYNLKIVIRGDRNSGKTCLWHRLQGHKFLEEYVPTPEIQATSIQWNYKATDDIVKVDVWDVVDKGKPKQQNKSLKLAHDNEEEDECRLDANFLDVYKGAHAVLVIFDITKKWTFDYVERELPKIPAHIPVLVLANHRDMGAHRVVILDEVEALTESINRPAGSAGIFFLESSMKTGFGLKYVHKFFNLPFLLVQRESLLKQLETNHLDVESCLEELRYEPTSEEQNYDHFLQVVQDRHSQKKQAKPAAESTQAINGHERTTMPSKPPAAAPTSSSNEVMKARAEPAKQKSPPTSLPVKAEPEPKSGGLFSPSMMTSTSPTEPQKEPEKKGFMSRFFKSSSAKSEVPRLEEEPPVIASNPVAAPINQAPVDIDKFVPDDEGTDNFLNDIPDSKLSKRFLTDRETEVDDDSSSDEDAGNPMVAGFQEELDSDDQISPGMHKVYSYSDSDDDYATSPKIPPTIETPASSRSQPRSRVSPQPHVEDKQLQHLEINSDDSFPEDNPYVMPDDDDISDVEMSFDKKLTRNVDDEVQATSNQSKINQSENKNKSIQNLGKVKNITDEEDASSDEETANAMVSTFIEDVGSDEDVSSSPKVVVEDEEETKKLNFKLETSDLDFLEQISTSTPEPASSTHKSSKSSSKHHHRKTKKKHEHDDEESSKKHKHKKKKSKGKDVDSSESKSSKKKHTKKKTAEENALEEFLAGGDDTF